MSRKIMVVSNQNNTRRMIESNAITRAELETELHNLGIQTEEMSFYEGFSRTELTDPNSQLPSTVMYKGRETTDLIIMLTPNSIKKVANGASVTRDYLLDCIQENNLESEVEERYEVEDINDVSTEEMCYFVTDKLTDCINSAQHEPKRKCAEQDDELELLESVEKLVTRLIEMKKIANGAIYNGYDIDEIAKEF